MKETFYTKSYTIQYNFLAAINASVIAISKKKKTAYQYRDCTKQLFVPHFILFKTIEAF